jgi:hypothetical protein
MSGFGSTLRIKEITGRLFAIATTERLVCPL